MKINKPEWKFVFVFSFLVILATFIPLMTGYLKTPEGYVFSGVTRVVDSNTYFDYMNQARDGHFVFINSYTSEDMDRFLVRPLFWLMGVVSLVLPSVFVWHLFRVVLGFAFLFSVYYLISMIFKKIGDRRIAFAFVALSSGLGWFFIMVYELIGKMFGSLLDFRQSAISFLALEGQPHTIASFFFMVLTFILLLKAVKKNTYRSFLLAGLSCFILGFIHPFDVISVFCVAVFFLLMVYMKEKRVLFKSFWFFVLGVPALIYYGSLTFFNEIFREWSKQNVIQSPNPWGYILGYGFIIVFVAVYLLRWYSWENLKKADYPLLLLLCWIVINPLLLYSPLKIEGRFIEGLHVPLAIIAALGFVTYALPWLSAVFRKRISRRVLIVLTIAFLALTNVYYIIDVSSEMKPDRYAEHKFRAEYYLLQEEYDALQWLSANTDPSETVLSYMEIGNYIPRIAGNRVVLGHWAQTVEFERRRAEARDFFSSGSASLIEQHDVSYIYAGPEEKSLGTINFDDHYDLAYSNDAVSIYKIK